MNAVDSLRASLADRYTIERELGAGSMATIYLAEDLTHRHKVVRQVHEPASTHRAVRASVGSTPEHPGGRHGDQS